MAFLKDAQKVEKLKANLKKSRFMDADGQDKEFWDSYEKNAPEWSNEPDNRTDAQKRWWQTYCTRDLANEVLDNISESTDNEILLINREESAKGDSWVEWSYIVNFKENTLAVHSLIDTPPIKVYSLDNLPEEGDFIADLEGIDEDE